MLLLLNVNDYGTRLIAAVLSGTWFPGPGGLGKREWRAVDLNEAFERMYRWYVLGCRMEEKPPISRDAFAEQQLLQALNGEILASDVFNRTLAEWELAREDATWTTILQRLSRLNLETETSDLVAAIQKGRDVEEDGDTGSAGIPAYIPPFMPVLVGAGAKLHPDLDPEPRWRDP